MKKKRKVVYVCLACGKISEDKYGNSNNDWDESCYMNSVTAYEDMITIENNRAKAIAKGGIVKEKKR